MFKFLSLATLCVVLMAFSTTKSPELNLVTGPVAGGTNYGSWSCELANGDDGCECTMTYNDDECSLVTDCTASSNLVNYNAELQNMFSPAEIANRAANGVAISEQPLKDALFLDGFPIIL